MNGKNTFQASAINWKMAEHWALNDSGSLEIGQIVDIGRTRWDFEPVSDSNGQDDNTWPLY